MAQKKCYLLICMLWMAALSFPYNLQQLSSKEGLSNSAILSICQDRDRFMWFGSVDGLNMYDGINIQIYKPTANHPNSLSGNMIEGIMETEPGVFWVRTNQGFNKLNKHTRRIEYHMEFYGKYCFAKTKDGRVFAIRRNNQIEYYDPAQRRFISLAYEGISVKDIMNFFIDSNQTLWIFYYNGRIDKAVIDLSDSIPSFSTVDDFTHDPLIMYCYNDGDKVFFIDRHYHFFELEACTMKKSLVCNLEDEMKRRGQVSRIIRDNDDYLVAFQTNGLIRLRNTPEKEVKYVVEDIDVNCGVLSLLKDNVQDIIWIGTDGQGVYMYSRNSYSMRSSTFNDIPCGITKPVRALFKDKHDCLWVGTRGDGLLRIRQYEFGKRFAKEDTELFTMGNSTLANNSTYTFCAGKRNLLWIGGDGPGLNYYSYTDQKIYRLKNATEHEDMQHIHAIYEANDSTLWLATGGNGFYKLSISWKGGQPEIRKVWQQLFADTDPLNNHFFSLCPESDSILWFGNRGGGAIRLNTQNNAFRLIKFVRKDTESINDILSIYKDSRGDMWFGSSFGLTKLQTLTADSVDYINYNEQDGLPNNTVHAITEDSEGRLWLSTNRGIAEFDPLKSSFRTYNYQNSLKVVEFSDGAFFNDTQTSSLFFGGTNGFVTIKQDIYKEKEYIPKIFFTGIKIYETAYNLSDLTQTGDKEGTLELKYDQNFFSISFVALDYINGRNYRYVYNLDGFNDKWIDNGSANFVTFTNISPGEYILRVKVQGASQLTSSDVYSLKIVILPPWYMSAWAYLAYALTTLLLSYYIIRTSLNKYRKKKELMMEKLNQQQKEEIYESKLRFFTNITHEFSTPLTLIHGPCDRLLSYEHADGYVKKYATLIMRNSERLNALIQELIEFRRIETGHKICEVECLNISDFALSIAESFNETAESLRVEYVVEIAPDISWNTDKNCFSKIVLNLLSNAFKYTREDGFVRIRMHQEAEDLMINVSNSGKGIREEDIPLIFDRYRVLENLEKHPGRGITFRNGLGLAICNSMVSLLEGQIEVKSAINELTEFVVKLPPVELTKTTSSEEIVAERLPLDLHPESIMPLTVKEEYQFLKSRPTIMVVDDDPEMLWFISEIFTVKYNIIPIEDARTVFKVIEHAQPDVIISDIMMPELDGITLTKMLKENRRIAHIPLILVSAKNTTEEQVEGINAGAEAYLTKPFNVAYLKSIVDRLISRQDDLKDYYSSVLSAFEFNEGQFIHKEDKAFFEKALKVIEKRMALPEFNAESLASELGLSHRHLARKLKDIANQKPSDLIRECRLVLVAKLLVSSKLTIEEIMYKTGFVNRGSFYKAFSQKYGVTPRVYRQEQKAKDMD